MNEKQSLRIRVTDLEAENGQLKNQIIDIYELHNKLHLDMDKRAEKAEQKIEQLKEALRKCLPYRIDAYIDMEATCAFCGMDFEQMHAEDCEYVRLVGGAK